MDDVHLAASARSELVLCLARTLLHAPSGFTVDCNTPPALAVLDDTVVRSNLSVPTTSSAQGGPLENRRLWLTSKPHPIWIFLFRPEVLN